MNKNIYVFLLLKTKPILVFLPLSPERADAIDPKFTFILHQL